MAGSVSEIALRRTVAVSAGVVALAAAWFEATSESGGGSWFGLAVVVAPSVAVVALAIVELRRRSTTIAFVVDAGRHVFRTRAAAEAIWWPPVVVVALTASFWSFAPTTWEPGTDPEWQVGVVEVAFTAFLGLVTVALMVIFLYGLWSGRPAIELTRDGVRVLAPFGYLAVPWDGLRPPGYPRRPTGTLWLSVTQRRLARRRGLGLMPLGWLDIHPWFLVDAIRYYIAHPEHRAAIGTAEEHDRLRHALAGEATRVVLTPDNGGR